MRKKTSPPQIGARAKRMQAIAERRRRSLGEFAYSQGGVKTSSEPQTIQVLLILFVSIAFAFVLTDRGVFDNFAREITGNFTIDQFIIGPGVPYILGDELLDKILVSIVRGLMIFLVAGIVPFCAKLYSKITDNAKTNIFVLHWGVLVTVPLLLYLMTSMLIPLVLEAIDLLVY